ncbi:MAG: phosphopantetheine-binding protein [Pseudomonadota bacterium]
MGHKKFDREALRQFIVKNMNVFDDEVVLLDDTNLFTSGFVNSIFAMRLLNYLETEYELEIPDEFISLTHFSSIYAMHELINNLQQVELT